MNDLMNQIIEFADDIAPKVPEATVVDVKDWASHTEWILALDVLAEHLFDSGNKFDEREWQQFCQIAVASGADARRYSYVDPNR
ncbi:hypothetical protein FB381_1063 [Nocardioides albertanoniae]|uniref:Uncharacterized protein n=1 Tax=Nocardioides albertanoniae TaxID=1175486 RepID=A0A543A3M3_9ACTN|nr:hypothetical protein [Nocardioides albertanoniae]TQL67190.1 hypothetical protein FB381_1063 [Nocardioides albertanoniae]